MNNISVESISFSIKGKRILDNISFNIKTKGITGLFGRSGVGKTSLLNIIFGVKNADQGNILWNNKAEKKCL